MVPNPRRASASCSVHWNTGLSPHHPPASRESVWLDCLIDFSNRDSLMFGSLCYVAGDSVLQLRKQFVRGCPPSTCRAKMQHFFSQKSHFEPELCDRKAASEFTLHPNIVYAITNVWVCSFYSRETTTSWKPQHKLNIFFQAKKQEQAQRIRKFLRGQRNRKLKNRLVLKIFKSIFILALGTWKYSGREKRIQKDKNYMLCNCVYGLSQLSASQVCFSLRPLKEVLFRRCSWSLLMTLSNYFC